MRFKVKKHKVCISIFMLIYVFCLMNSLLVYGIKSESEEINKNSNITNKINEFINQLDNDSQSSLTDVLNEMEEDISEKALNNILALISSGISEETLEEFLIDQSKQIKEEKQLLNDFKEKIDCCSKIMSEEKTFVTIKNIKNLVAVGDLHGDADSAKVYIEEIRKKLKRDELDHVVFLGDYVDRGPNSLEVLRLVINLKLDYPNKVTLLRGNHETKNMFENFEVIDPENNTKEEICREFPLLSDEYINGLTESLLKWFDSLPLAADITIDSPGSQSVRKILAIHGGFPCEENSDIASNEEIWEEFMSLKKTNQRNDVNECVKNGIFSISVQILWNDFSVFPLIKENFLNCSRGCGRMISQRMLKIFCNFYGYDFIIRGHTFNEKESFYNLRDKCYTIFSASNYNDTGSVGCIAYFDYDRREKLVIIKKSFLL